MLLALVPIFAFFAPSTAPAAAVASPSASAASPTGAGANARDAVSIVNSGSTNFAGYELQVRSNGDLVSGPGSGARRRVSPALARRLFADLLAAGPLGRLTAGSCMKSASFGTWTRITYRGETSPDLSCPSPSRALRALAADAAAVTDAAGIHPALRGRTLLR
jgi:hypothetical protein